MIWFHVSQPAVLVYGSEPLPVVQDLPDNRVGTSFPWKAQDRGAVWYCAHAVAQRLVPWVRELRPAGWMACSGYVVVWGKGPYKNGYIFQFPNWDPVLSVLLSQTFH